MLHRPNHWTGYAGLLLFLVLQITIVWGSETSGVSPGVVEVESPSEPTSSAGADVLLEGELAGVGSDELLLFADIPMIEIFSVSKKEQKLLETPAAVYVVTSEDIRRSGATSVMEALRMVPGVHVARNTVTVYSISARGFAMDYAKKMLVLVDGRSVYTPLFSGVYWVLQDMVLEDIDRIEVIRGPGGTLWGANAVNGVINIITKKASDTQGFLVSGTTGSKIIGKGTARYGGKLNEKTSFRVYSQYTQQERYGDPVIDPMEMYTGGFRIDSDLTAEDRLSMQGNVRRGASYGPAYFFGFADPLRYDFVERYELNGSYLLGRWDHRYSETSDMSLQMYYDQMSDYGRSGGESRDTYDIDFQHRFELMPGQELMWGLGYRYTQGVIRNRSIGAYYPIYQFDNRCEGDYLYSGFVQDDITLIKDRLHLIVGSKFEHNDYTGFECQPSGRLVWTPDAKNTLWGSISRAVRTPSWSEDQVVVQSLFDAGGIPGRFSLYGNQSLESEDVIAYEAGYRVQPRHDFFVDAAAFYNVYDKQISAVTGTPGFSMDPVPHIEIPAVAGNTMWGHTWGVETSANWNVTKDWRLSGGYSFIDITVNNVNPDVQPYFDSKATTPQNQFNVRSNLNLPHDLELDTMLYYVDNLPGGGVPHYLRFDVRVGWKPTENIELSFAALNLLDPEHPEIGTLDFASAEVPRSFFGQVTIRF